MCQIEGSQGSRQKALDLDPEKIAIRSILGSARPRPSAQPLLGADQATIPHMKEDSQIFHLTPVA